MCFSLGAVEALEVLVAAVAVVAWCFTTLTIFFPLERTRQPLALVALVALQHSQWLA